MQEVQEQPDLEGMRRSGKCRVGQETKNTVSDNQSDLTGPLEGNDDRESEINIMAGQQGLGGDQMPRFNAELDTDTDSMGGRMPKMRTVGPGIEARIKLLFNCDDMDKVDREEKKQCEVLMNEQKVTTIKRRKRTGQRREEGVRVVKLDSWLKKNENSNSQLA